MTFDITSVSRESLPYRNLVLTGFLGVGKSTVGRMIARTVGVEMYDIDEEIELREVMAIVKIRELYGDARLRALEHEYSRRAALMRQAVIIASGTCLLDPRNYRLFSETGQIVVLTCELGEALRRLHLGGEQRFRDPRIREQMLARLRREHAIVNDGQLLQMDTTHLTVEEESRLLIKLWATGEPEGAYFRLGPPPPLKPPQKPIVGLSGRGTAIRQTPPQFQ